ncbi:VOC family protein [Streptomyces sp. NPDC127049]|uniref:VOC family protein n=1 Tax=Streptomyces sp. NPDC127049 TaxID=3347118 RepID=UPI003653C638
MRWAGGNPVLYGAAPRDVIAWASSHSYAAGPEETPLRIDLVVIYTDRLEACRAFYAALGATFVRERHGTGPEHYAAVLDDGAVLELYPAAGRAATGPVRLGFAAPAGAGEARRRVLTDPDGRTVVVTPA